MPIGKNGETPSGNGGQDRPVVFQKYFKSGGRTYAAQIKLAINGRRYLVLTEGVRDTETQEVKKHYIRVHEQDLKEFFSMLQETVVYLRSTKGAADGSVAGAVVSRPAPTPVRPPQPRPTASSRPASPVKPSNGKPAPKAPAPLPAKPVARGSAKPPVQVAKKQPLRTTSARSR